MNMLADWRPTRSRTVLFFVIAISSVFGIATSQAQSEQKDIVETAASAGNFQTLVTAVQAAELVETLQQSGPFTVFAPSDDAFARLPAKKLKSLLKPNNKGKLAATLTYHVVPGRLTAREAFGVDSVSTANGQRLEVAREDGKLTVGGATIVAADIDCSNGVIHVIDQVLLPETKRIPALAEKAGQFRTLLSAVSAAGLADVLDGDGPFTLFAPTDEAFAALPEGTVASLLKPENEQQLIDLLKNHVLSGRVYSEDAARTGQAVTLLGSGVEISVEADGLRINDALVLDGDIQAANGVIHVVDSVILPRPIGPIQARSLIENAISRGVPAFNRGDRGQCADIYSAACQAIVGSADAKIPGDVIAALEAALSRADATDDDLARAWALRDGMDVAWAGLGERSTPAGNTENVNGRELFSFEESDASAKWRTTNDGVMGGRSDGRFRINEDNNMVFFGTLSLANNGGFASVRSTGSNLGLKQGDAIVARVRGDGREYSLNLYTPTRRMAFSYRATFQTREGEWIEVSIPLEEFAATSFGRVISTQPIDASQVSGLGFLLGDKKAGPFELEVEWIKAVGTGG